MIRWITLFCIVLSSITLNAQTQVYSRVKISLNDQSMASIAQMGIPLEGEIKQGAYFITELDQYHLMQMTLKGLDYEVLIEDVTAYYLERNLKQDLVIPDGTSDYPVPDGWEYGTMGGFYTFHQMKAELDTMVMLYPELISVIHQMDSTSIEDRPIYWIRISDNPNVNEAEPEVLYTAIHHAREPIGLQQMIYYMYYLLENYETNEEVYFLINSTEMYFVPCINPDGYVYNEAIYPNGGGMWRKNRRNNGGGAWGVDLNRNYGYKWGYNNSGSSPDPWELTYRGTAPFSEPETQAIREFCAVNTFKVTLNYHSYGNLLLYPWGWTTDPCADDAVFEKYAAMMTGENEYTYGPGNTTIYPTNGGSDDWMYGDTLEKNPVLAYTPEVGSSNDGFWPQINRIVPLCKENMLQNILAAKLAGKYAVIENKSPFVVEYIQGYFKFSLQRLGQTNADFTISIVPVSDEIVEVGDAVVISDLEVLETVEDSISYLLEPGVPSGQPLAYLLAVSNGEFTEYKTVTKIYGQTSVVFWDEGSNLENWNGTWDITFEDYYSPASSITDSPNSNYGNNAARSLTLNQYINLENVVYAEMSFRAKWEIEDGYDFVQVLISDNGGINWTALEGRYTNPGSQHQAPGQPVYDGTEEMWVKEYFDLSGHIGENIRLRFFLKSNGYLTGDGFYFDDLKVAVIDELTSAGDPLDNPINIILPPVPNPAHQTVTFYLYKTELMNPITCTIFNSLGQQMTQYSLLPGQSKLQMDVSLWETGIYFYKISKNETGHEAGKLIIL